MNPSLTDLIKLWCEDVLPPKYFERAQFVDVAFSDAIIFRLGSLAIAHIYGDFVFLLDAPSLPTGKLFAADPDFFEKFAQHIISRAKPAQNVHLTTF